MKRFNANKRIVNGKTIWGTPKARCQPPQRVVKVPKRYASSPLPKPMAKWQKKKKSENDKATAKGKAKAKPPSKSTKPTKKYGNKAKAKSGSHGGHKGSGTKKGPERR